jgi:pyrophosphate--fructose-6-phosphate 1-phosphotransferase
MGRNCGWLTAATALEYRRQLQAKTFLADIGAGQKQFDVHGIYIPEMVIDIEAEAKRLRKVMDENDCVNIFISEGAGVADIVKEMEAKGEAVPRDAFGHVKLDAVNPGKWFGQQFAAMLGAEKTLIQKSGYYARAAASNNADLALIKSCVDYAVECAQRGESGVMGHDEDQGGRLRAIEFARVKGGKPFDITQPWFKKLVTDIGQPAPVAAELPEHH